MMDLYINKMKIRIKKKKTGIMTNKLRNTKAEDLFSPRHYVSCFQNLYKRFQCFLSFSAAGFFR
jgi:hypothetical protein